MQPKMLLHRWEQNNSAKYSYVWEKLSVFLKKKWNEYSLKEKLPL